MYGLQYITEDEFIYQNPYFYMIRKIHDSGKEFEMSD